MVTMDGLLENWKKAIISICCPRGQKEESGELQVVQPPLDSWESVETTIPGNYFQVHEGAERDRE